MALPATLLFGWLLTKLIVPLAAKRHQQIGLALGLSVAIEFANPWLLPSLGLRFAYLASLPNPILLFGIVPALTWTVAPIMALFVLLNRSTPRLLPIDTGTPSRLAFLKTLIVSCMLLLCNSSVPLLLSGGRPFNATHTLPSWIFSEVWVNGDYLRALVQAGLLSVGLLGCNTILLICEPVSGRKKQAIRMPLLAILPALLSVVPYSFRLAGWVDGRMPLLVTELLVTTGIILGSSIFKTIANPVHGDKPAWVGRVGL
ncbi:MAG: hypothetical protein U0175_32485 [Caldilineaceae bacterium]